MDNASLNELLNNPGERQFWLKPWGDPARPAEDEERFFNSSDLTIGFAVNPNAVEVGDILFVHRIGYAKLMLIAEAVSSPRQATEIEKRNNPLLERWGWLIEARNLTTSYGSEWFNHSLKTFSLAKDFKKANPNENFTLGSINFGSDKLKIPKSFGEFLVRKIVEIN